MPTSNKLYLQAESEDLPLLFAKQHQLISCISWRLLGISSWFSASHIHAKVRSVLRENIWQEQTQFKLVS